MLTQTNYDFNSENIYQAEIRDFLECIPKGIRNRANIAHAVLTSELMDLIYRSSELKCEISTKRT